MHSHMCKIMHVVSSFVSRSVLSKADMEVSAHMTCILSKHQSSSAAAMPTDVNGQPCCENWELLSNLCTHIVISLAASADCKVLLHAGSSCKSHKALCRRTAIREEDVRHKGIPASLQGPHSLWDPYPAAWFGASGDEED